MKNRARAAAVTALLAASLLAAPAAANAHYNPWTTHWHYNSSGQPTYKMCSWWDATFTGCRHGYR